MTSSTVTPQATVTYKVTVVTGNVDNAGTDSNIKITIYGTDGAKVGPLALSSSADDFERNSTRTYNLSSPDLGTLTKFTLHSDGANAFAGWYVSGVTIENGTTGKKYTAVCDAWLGEDGAESRTFEF